MKLNKFSVIVTVLLLGNSSLFGAFEGINVSSSTHSTTNATQSTDIALSWAVPTVTDTTELNGYYYKLDENTNTLMDNSNTILGKTATSKMETVSATNIEKSYYFHIAAYATNGDIGATVHFGPIKIDTKSPTDLTILPDGGTYTSSQNISMNAVENGGYAIYYTENGDTPTSNSTLYNSPISVNSTKTIKAIAIDRAGNESVVKVSVFTINSTTPPPTSTTTPPPTSTTTPPPTSTTPPPTSTTTPPTSTTPPPTSTTTPPTSTTPPPTSTTPPPTSTTLPPTSTTLPPVSTTPPPVSTTPPPTSTTLPPKIGINEEFDIKGGENITIVTEIETEVVKNSDGDIVVSTNNHEIELHTDGTVRGRIEVGEDPSEIEVNTVGADIKVSENGSMELISTILNSTGGEIISRVNVREDGTMSNSISIMGEDGKMTVTTINSNIVGTDTIIFDDGSMTMTTPPVKIFRKNEEGEDIEVSVDFEISLDLEGKISVNVNGEEYDLPEFEAGSTLNIQEEIDNIILQIETTLSQTITFN